MRPCGAAGGCDPGAGGAPARRGVRAGRARGGPLFARQTRQQPRGRAWWNETTRRPRGRDRCVGRPSSPAPPPQRRDPHARAARPTRNGGGTQNGPARGGRAVPRRGLCRHLPAGAVRVSRPGSPLALRAPLAHAPTRGFTRLGLIRERAARLPALPAPSHPVPSWISSRAGSPHACERARPVSPPSGRSPQSVPWCLPALSGPCCWPPHLQSLQANSPTR